MRPPTRAFGPTMTLLLALSASACAESGPEIVAAEYLRAADTGSADKAIALLDVEQIVDRVQQEIVVVNTDGDPRSFLRDSVETVLWGLFQEMERHEERGYDPQAAEVRGDRAAVRVIVRSPDGEQHTRTVHLRKTDGGWKVSGESVEDLVAYVIQRLEERY